MHTGRGVKAPTLNDLTLLKYVDQGEETEKIEIINEACHKWRDIACLICSDANRISILDEQYRGDPKKCLQQTFIDNFINRKPQSYSQDWTGLITLLHDVHLDVLATNVEKAVSPM